MIDDLIHVDPTFLSKWNKAVPRYTSYPTAPQFKEVEEALYIEKLKSFDKTQKPLSLYFHIPFCKTMCLFCGCSVVLNRKPERAADYFTHLLREIELVTDQFLQKRSVSQLHLGGGTPTSLTEEQFVLLMEKVRDRFTLTENAEISIEIDPRTVFSDGGSKLKLLKELGFNRVSFGVQDLDPVVQEAVRRRQSEEMTVTTYYKAREMGFDGINIDLIYGLPHQTVKSFAKTADRLVALKPDRIAFYSYAKIPWLKEHQKAIPDETLPSVEEKFRIYVDARARFMKGGYTAIGMDHFACASDPMAEGYRTGKLTRNFQGYALELAEDMIGFGLTSIGYIENSYFQNTKDLGLYQKQIQEGHLPSFRGYVLSEDDRLRRSLILDLMCHFAIAKKRLPEVDLTDLMEDGLITETADQFVATPMGRLFIRLIAAKFDAYISKGQFSRAV